MNATDSSAFGQAIKLRRKELGYTQQYISDFTGFSVSFLSELENGKPTAEIGKALYVANLLGLDIGMNGRGNGSAKNESMQEQNNYPLEKTSYVQLSHDQIFTAVKNEGGFGCRLFHDMNTGKWYKPEDGKSGNYLVKFCNPEMQDFVANEKLCLLAAKKLGLIVAESFILESGTGSAKETLLASKLPECKIETLDSLEKDFSLFNVSQISFSQQSKNGQEQSIKSALNTIIAYSREPMKDQIQFWKSICYSYMIGNASCSLENYSLIQESESAGFFLAPLSGIYSTIIYKDSPSLMNFPINGKYEFLQVTKEDLFAEAKKIFLAPKLATEIFVQVQQNLKTALENSAQELENAGITSAHKICWAIISKAKERGLI